MDGGDDVTHRAAVQQEADLEPLLQSGGSVGYARILQRK
jgi:hypothetical protein